MVQSAQFKVILIPVRTKNKKYEHPNTKIILLVDLRIKKNGKQTVKQEKAKIFLSHLHRL